MNSKIIFIIFYFSEIEATRDGTALSFSVNPVDDDTNMLESANLRLLLDHDEGSDAGELEVRVYQYQESFARRSSSSRIGRLVGQRVIQEADALRCRWLEFDLTEELQDITREDVLRLLVQVVQKVLINFQFHKSRMFLNGFDDWLKKK